MFPGRFSIRYVSFCSDLMQFVSTPIFRVNRDFFFVIRRSFRTFRQRPRALCLLAVFGALVMEISREISDLVRGRGFVVVVVKFLRTFRKLLLCPSSELRLLRFSGFSCIFWRKKCTVIFLCSLSALSCNY